MLKIYRDSQNRIIFDYDGCKQVFDKLRKDRYGNIYASFQRRSDNSQAEVLLNKEQLKALKELGIKML